MNNGHIDESLTHITRLAILLCILEKGWLVIPIAQNLLHSDFSHKISSTNAFMEFGKDDWNILLPYSST
jgi:hypothetical protein